MLIYYFKKFNSRNQFLFDYNLEIILQFPIKISLCLAIPDPFLDMPTIMIFFYRTFGDSQVLFQTCLPNLICFLHWEIHIQSQDDFENNWCCIVSVLRQMKIRFRTYSFYHRYRANYVIKVRASLTFNLISILDNHNFDYFRGRNYGFTFNLPNKFNSMRQQFSVCFFSLLLGSDSLHRGILNTL